MSAGWVAGSVRARLLLGRRFGARGARELASAPSLDSALSRLAGTAYARAAEPGPELEAVQHQVATVTLLQLRLLAGWLPRDAAELLRPLAGWFELANIEDRLAYLAGGRLRPAFELGSLASVWPQASLAQNAEELCDVLAGSAWAYGGGPDPRELQEGLRFAWAARVLAAAPEAHAWVAGAVALMLNRTDVSGGLEPNPRARQAAGLPADPWPLEGVESAEDLWRAEAGWWRRVEAEATTLARGARAGRSVIVGVVALLALDAVQVNAALGAAARGGGVVAKEALDALV